MNYSNSNNFKKNRVVHFKLAFLGSISVLLFFLPFFYWDKAFLSDGQRAAYNQTFSLWSGDWLAGWPLIADVASMPIYPLRLLMNYLGASFNAFMCVAYIISFLGMYFFLARRQGSGPASIGALSFALSGWMLTHLGHSSMIHSAIWLPWILFGFELTMSSNLREFRSGLIVIALSVAMSSLAGHLQIVVYSIMLAGLYGAFVSYKELRFKAFFSSMIAVCCGLGFASPMLFPLLQLKSFSFRDLLDAQTIFEYSFPAVELPGLIFPLFFGATPYGLFAQPYARPEYMGETLIFFPAIILLLALISSFVNDKSRSYSFFWFFVVIVAIFLSMGDAVMLFGWVTQHVPPLNSFRAPSRHLLEATFGLSVLASMGTKAVIENKNSFAILKGIGIFFLLCITSIVAILLLPEVGIYSSKKILGNQLLPVAAATAFIVFSMLIVWVISKFKFKRTASLFVIGLLFASQSIIIGYQLPWNIYAPIRQVLESKPDWVSDFDDKIGSQYRVLGLDGWTSRVFEPVKSREFGLRTLGWYGPLLNKPMSELSGVTSGGWVRRESLLPFNRALDILSVRYVSINNKEAALFKDYPLRWKFVREYGNETVFENLNVLPRARIVCQLSVSSKSQDILMAIQYQNVRPFPIEHAALVGSEYEHLNSGEKKCDSEALIVKDNADSLQISTKSTTGGYLIVSDTWYPGWKASANGVPTDVLKVNHALRAVSISPGNNLIELHYSPPLFWVGLAGFFLSVGVLFLLNNFELRKID